MGKNEQELSARCRSYFDVNIFFCTSYCPPKKIIHNPKERKKFHAPENCPSPPPSKKIKVCPEILTTIIIKFPYNARPDWLKQRALSENRARIDDGKLASSNFCFGILTNLTQIKHALWLRQMQWKQAICLQ